MQMYFKYCKYSVLKQTKRNLIGVNKEIYATSGVVIPTTVLEKDDTVLLFGASTDLRNFLKRLDTIKIQTI